MTDPTTTVRAWAVTLLMSGTLIVGALIAQDLPAARAFGIIGGVAIVVMSAYHNLIARL
jgi:hypothetical protein